MSTNLHSNRRDPSDLDWLAFQYVAGELDDEATIQFEHRLEEDQTAREAVARAVELGESLSQALRHPLTTIFERRPANWFRRLSWMAAGAAACLVAMFAWSPSDHPDSIASTITGGDTGALALVWAHATEQTAALEQSSVNDAASGSEKSDQDIIELHGFAPPPASELEAGTTSLDGTISVYGTDAPMLEAPSWMVTAVEGLCGELAREDGRAVE